jgi:uncharacterized membrane protein YkvA (DUF1232 family)
MNTSIGDSLDRLRRIAGRAGLTLVERALWLHYAALRPETPQWAKAVAWSAVAYLLLPLDAVPDALPGTGYVDDLATIAYAVHTISRFVDEEVRARTRRTLQRWFPQSAAFRAV